MVSTRRTFKERRQPRAGSLRDYCNWVAISVWSLPYEVLVERVLDQIERC